MNRKEFLHQVRKYYTKQLMYNMGNIFRSAFLIGSVADAAADFGYGLSDLI